jgi:methylmalonyl-CoA mutase
VRNFYSVSISGYHIAEAGANPITQLAFTLSNGFTFVEYYLSRGMAHRRLRAEPVVLLQQRDGPRVHGASAGSRAGSGASVMLRKYGANARSQMLKYHIQTSGRSLHAQEIQFNDIRTTLQALYALFDNCNSLHTNAYDEAITTPTEESVRRAVAIQLVINRELGLNFCENPWQGSVHRRLPDGPGRGSGLRGVRAHLERGGVLGAMDTMYQRSKIQEESLYYEHKKHDGSLPLIGVNTFLPKDHAGEVATTIELIRSTEAEKQQQIDNVRGYQAARNAVRLPSGGDEAPLKRLQIVARARQNLFAALIEAVKTHSLGQISHALYDVGGEYRRNM